MSKRIPKKSKKRLIVFGIPCLIVILYFIFQLMFYVYKIYDLKSEEHKLNNQLNDEKFKEKELRTEIDKLHDPDYIARYARETYSYSKNGEYIIKLKDKTKKNQEEFNIDINIDYPYLILGGIGLFIIIILISSKKKD